MDNFWKTSEQYRHEGACAYNRGGNMTENPYGHGSEAWYDWRAGFRGAWQEEPLAPWERELLGGYSTVTFTLTDGRTVEFDRVNVDSVGPGTSAPGVIAVEFTNDTNRVVHVPFVQHWEFTHH